jgi:serine/threonine protein kinase
MPRVADIGFSHSHFKGLENLQHSGICHRDMSLENLLVHESGALIIDMGMCLRVPLLEDLSRSMQTMGLTTTNGYGNTNNAAVAVPPASAKNVGRYMISPQGTCGKWIYMSPEIFKSKEAFDGFAIDMWAAGVILFLMLTGFPPWERACPTDERFKYMTAGYLVQMLTEWELGLSADVMDLLQRMLFLDPKDRLSLEQVRAHPWMLGATAAPPGFGGRI